MRDNTMTDMPPDEDAGVVAELAAAWRARSSTRDPRDRYIAMCRAMEIPDAANPIVYGRALAQVLPGAEGQIEARAEREYRALAEDRSGYGVVDDAMSRWLLQQRDLEDTGSSEWWAVDRVRRRYLDQVAVLTDPVGKEPTG